MVIGEMHLQINRRQRKKQDGLACYIWQRRFGGGSPSGHILVLLDISQVNVDEVSSSRNAGSPEEHTPKGIWGLNITRLLIGKSSWSW